MTVMSYNSPLGNAMMNYLIIIPLPNNVFKICGEDLSHDPELHQQYRGIIRDYVEQGIIEEVKADDGDTLPHQDESSSDFPVDEGPQSFSQSELNDLVRDLGLSKHGAELLGSRLKNKNLLIPRTLFSWYRHREKESTLFFSKERNFVFCNDVQGLMKCFDREYDPSEWHLFIDSSKASLN
ncbi:hypothetical protein AVEN_266158-1 [Araneus ventricosus]|uniref:Uncharacterized protein n=1 Tax=Araneus ventricosus TaxID=182803 RepID=A0A4Y2T2L2_ARAVE|nr:hypothetical protein AVEN_266158-1 [Araneus ventricosus]